MKWQDLSDVSANLLEKCWSVHCDFPMTFKVKFGELLDDKSVEMKHYEEILEYRKVDDSFNVKLLEDGIYVEGNLS